MAQGASVLNFQSGGNSNKRLRDHRHSEEVEGYRSRRLPPCAGMERAPEEQSRVSSFASNRSTLDAEQSCEPKDTSLIAVLWLLREIETAAIICEDVHEFGGVSPA